MPRKVSHSSPKPYTVYLTIAASKPVALAIKGFEIGQPRTVYFERTYGSDELGLFQGVKTFEIPMPIKPGRLKIQAYDSRTGRSTGIEVTNIRLQPLKKGAEAYTPEMTEFVEFAKAFAQQAHYLPIGTYTSSSGRYKIHMVDTIYDENSIAIDTAARTNMVTEEIWVKAQDIGDLTVFNVATMLMHEIGHSKLNLNNGTNEDEMMADMAASDLLRNEGFSKTERLGTLINLFQDDTINKDEKDERIINLYNHILNEPTI